MAAGSAGRSEPTLRMCPSFRSSRMEAASPRAAGEPAAPGRHRRGRSAALGQRRAEGARRPLHPLQALQAGMPLGRGRLEPDGRGEGGLCRDAWPGAARLGLLAAGGLGATGEPVAHRHQLPPDAAMGRAGSWSGCWASRDTASYRASGGRRSPDAGRGWGSTSRARSSPARGWSTSSTSSPTTTTRSWPRRPSRSSATPG